MRTWKNGAFRSYGGLAAFSSVVTRSAAERVARNTSEPLNAVAGATAFVAGIARGCTQAGAALAGGETAEMPGMYAPGEYDLAGCIIGVVDRAQIIDGARIKPGDAPILVPLLRPAQDMDQSIDKRMTADFRADAKDLENVPARIELKNTMLIPLTQVKMTTVITQV